MLPPLWCVPVPQVGAPTQWLIALCTQLTPISTILHFLSFLMKNTAHLQRKQSLLLLGVGRFTVERFFLQWKFFSGGSALKNIWNFAEMFDHKQRVLQEATMAFQSTNTQIHILGTQYKFNIPLSILKPGLNSRGSRKCMPFLSLGNQP